MERILCTCDIFASEINTIIIMVTVMLGAHLPTRRSSRRYGQSALNLRRLLANAHLPTRLSSFVAILVVNLINTCARELTSKFAEHVGPTLPTRCGATRTMWRLY